MKDGKKQRRKAEPAKGPVGGHRSVGWSGEDLETQIMYLEGKPDPKTFRAFQARVRHGQVRVRGVWTDLAPFADRLEELENQVTIMEVHES